MHASIHYYGYASGVIKVCYIKRNGTEVLGSYNYGAGVVEAFAYIDVETNDEISIASRASSASQAIDYQSGGGYRNTYIYIEYI